MARRTELLFLQPRDVDIVLDDNYFLGAAQTNHQPLGAHRRTQQSRQVAARAKSHHHIAAKSQRSADSALILNFYHSIVARGSHATINYLELSFISVLCVCGNKLPVIWIVNNGLLLNNVLL